MNAPDRFDWDAYDPEDIAKIKTLVEFIVDMLEVDLERNPDRLRTALTHLIARAESIYPALERGEPVQMDRPHLGPEWDLPWEVGDIYLRLVGDVLFAGVDGPRPTGAAVRFLIDDAERQLKEKLHA